MTPPSVSKNIFNIFRWIWSGARAGKIFRHTISSSWWRPPTILPKFSEGEMVICMKLLWYLFYLNAIYKRNAHIVFDSSLFEEVDHLRNILYVTSWFAFVNWCSSVIFSTFNSSLQCWFSISFTSTFSMISLASGL